SRTSTKGSRRFVMSVRWARIEHVHAVDVVSRRALADGEKRLPPGVEIVEQAAVSVGQLELRPTRDRRAAFEHELQVRRLSGREAGRVADGRSSYRHGDGMGLRYQQQ